MRLFHLQLIYVTVRPALRRHKPPMTMIELSLSLLALLATPGPTNTLLALAGAQGVRRPMVLPLVELVAYMSTVVPLAIWGHRWLEAAPQLRLALTVAAGIWVAVLALRLWHQSTRPLASRAPTVTPLQVGITTLLNPKALVFGLVLIPQAGDLGTGLAVFAGLVILVSLGWLRLGAMISGRLAPMVNRGGAVWLGLLAAALFSRALTA